MQDRHFRKTKKYKKSTLRYINLPTGPCSGTPISPSRPVSNTGVGPAAACARRLVNDVRLCALARCVALNGLIPIRRYPELLRHGQPLLFTSIRTEIGDRRGVFSRLSPQVSSVCHRPHLPTPSFLIRRFLALCTRSLSSLRGRGSSSIAAPAHESKYHRAVFAWTSCPAQQLVPGLQLDRTPSVLGNRSSRITMWCVICCYVVRYLIRSDVVKYQ